MEIPQADEGAAIQSSADGKVLQTCERQGVLFLWAAPLFHRDEQPDLDLLNRIALQEVFDTEGVQYLDYSRDLPMDISILMENVLDPAHLPFTHHSTISDRGRAAPVYIKADGPVKEDGFTASRKTAAAGGSLIYLAPNLVVGLTDRSESGSFRDWNVVYATPSRPGRCRVFVRIVFEVPKIPVPLRYVIQWAFSPSIPVFFTHIYNHQILEDDNVFLHLQGETFMPDGKMRGDWKERMHMPTGSDTAVVLYKRWLEQFGSRGVLWARPVQAAASALATLDKEALLERAQSHTEHCASCKGALAVSKTGQQVAELFILLGLLAVGLAEMDWKWLPAVLVVLTYLVRATLKDTEAKLTHGTYPPPRNLS